MTDTAEKSTTLLTVAGTDSSTPAKTTLDLNPEVMAKLVALVKEAIDQQIPGVPDRYLTKRQLAQAFQVSPRCVDNWVRNNSIPFLRISKTIRFNPKQVQEHLQSKTLANYVRR